MATELIETASPLARGKETAACWVVVALYLDLAYPYLNKKFNSLNIKYC